MSLPPINYPTSLDDNTTLPSNIVPGPLGIGSPITTPSHPDLHNNISNAIRALETRSGADYGIGVGDGTDRTAQIQAAINAAEAAGGGRVLLSYGTYLCTGLILPANVVLEGLGRRITVLKLIDGTNADLIVTKDFVTLTGTNKWLISEGVPTRFGVRNMTLDGNRDNNASGYVLKIYGKAYMLDNLDVFNGASGGIYSECAYKGGQEVDDDMPEAHWAGIWVRDAIGNGVTYNGPHDGRIDSIWIAECTGIGFTNGVLANTYNGSVDIGFAHIYANDQGIVTNIEARIDTLISESNNHEGAILTGDRTIVGNALLYRNQVAYQSSEAPQGNAHLSIGGETNVGNVNVQTQFGGTAVLITKAGASADPILIGTLRAQGFAKGGIGLDIQTRRFQVADADITGFSGSGGIGMRLGSDSDAVFGTKVRATLYDNDTGVVDVAGGNRNEWYFDLYSNTGQTAYSLSGTTTVNGTDNVVAIRVGGSSGQSNVIIGPAYTQDRSPDVDGTRKLGTSSLRYDQTHSKSFRVHLAAGDAIPGYKLDAAGLSAGAGGSNALDAVIHRANPHVWQTADTMNVGTLRLNVLDHDPPVNGDSPTGTLGAGDFYISSVGGVFKLHVRFAGVTKSVTLS